MYLKMRIKIFYRDACARRCATALLLLHAKEKGMLESRTAKYLRDEKDNPPTLHSACILFRIPSQPPSSGMQESAPQPQKPKADTQFFKAFVAGGGAGMLAALITCPVEVVKTKLQVQIFPASPNPPPPPPPQGPPAHSSPNPRHLH